MHIYRVSSKVYSPGLIEQVKLRRKALYDFLKFAIVEIKISKVGK